MIGGAAKIMKPYALYWKIPLTGLPGFIQVLHGCLIFKPATFQQYYFLFCIGKFHSETDACSASANYTDIAFYDRIVIKVSRINVHVVKIIRIEGM